jgi:hypothetical protein
MSLIYIYPSASSLEYLIAILIHAYILIAGIILLVGPSRVENHFKYEQRPATANYTPTIANVSSAIVRFVLPPFSAANGEDRHTQYK